MLPHPKNERQRSVNDLKSYTFENQWAALSDHAKVTVLAGVIAKKANDTVFALSKK